VRHGHRRRPKPIAWHVVDLVQHGYAFRHGQAYQASFQAAKGPPIAALLVFH